MTEIRTTFVGSDEIVGALHRASGTLGVLIVSGGIQPRSGAHRRLVLMARALADAGISSYRFDRRGVGDSGGIDRGFLDMTGDVTAALADFRKAMPGLTSIAGWGLCDGAATLVENARLFDRLVLLNPWPYPGSNAPVGAGGDAHYYRRKLKSPAALLRLVTGRISFRSVSAAIRRLANGAPAGGTGDGALEARLRTLATPALILLSSEDATARAFDTMMAQAAMASGKAEIARLPQADHTLSRDKSFSAMMERMLAFLGARSS